MIELNTLRKKLLVWLLIPLLALYAVRITHTFFRSTAISNDVYDRELRSTAKSLLDKLVFDHGKLDIPPNEVLQALLLDERDTIYFTVRDLSGRVIAGNEKLPIPRNALEGTYSFFDGTIRNENVRIVALRHAGSIQKNQAVLVQVAETLHKRQTLTHEILSSALITQALIITLVTATVWFGVKRSLTSLQKLQHAVTNRSHLDLSPLDEREAPGEVQPLIHSINDLMNRLEKVMESQNRFIGDAAHQLRTPLAGLKAQIAISLRQDTLANTRIHVQKLDTSVDRMGRLVNQLLALMRSKPGAEKMFKKEEVSLNRLASAITMEWVPAALKKQIDLGFESDGANVVIWGNASRLKEMIDNLLDNAIRYTPTGGHVTVKVSGEDSPVLVVQDNGDGVPPAEQELVFERFYRVLGSRADGSGLGLAIAKEIALAHGGEISLCSNPGGTGTVVSVGFPHTSAT